MPMRYFDANHGFVVLEQLQSLRLEGLLTDISLQVNADLFPCHRSVLTASSQYFKVMFTGGMLESRQETVTLQDIEPSSLRILLDFLYTGNIILDNQNVQGVFKTAHYLQVVSLINFCEDYMEKNVSITNCIGIHSLATRYSCASLLEAAWECINYNFASLSTQEEFLNAPGNVVQSIVRSRMLNVSSEGDVFEAVFQWYKEDLSKVTIAQEIMKHVKVDSLDRAQIAMAREHGLLPSGLEAGPTTSDTNQNINSESTALARLGMSAQQFILMKGIYHSNEGRENSLFCVHLPSKQCYFLDMPPISNPFLAVVNNELYVTPSCDDEDKRMFHYIHIRNEWKEVSPRLEGLTGFQMKEVGGNIYVFGGITGSTHKMDTSVECYNPSVGEWKYVTPMPYHYYKTLKYPNFGLTSAAHQDCIYVFCDLENLSHRKTMCYNTVTDIWTTNLPPMPTPRNATCVTLGNEILMIGGYDHARNLYSSKVDKYLPVESRWESGGYLPILLRCCKATVYQDKLYLCGDDYDNVARFFGEYQRLPNGEILRFPECELFLYDNTEETFTDTGINIPLILDPNLYTARLFTGKLIPQT